MWRVLYFSIVIIHYFQSICCSNEEKKFEMQVNYEVSGICSFYLQQQTTSTNKQQTSNKDQASNKQQYLQLLQQQQQQQQQPQQQSLPVQQRERILLSHSITNPNGDYISIHFSKFNISPSEYVLLQSVEDTSLFQIYGSNYNANNEGFWSNPLPTGTVLIEYRTVQSTNDNNNDNDHDDGNCTGFEIDMYRSGTESSTIQLISSPQESACIEDNSVSILCALPMHQAAFEASKAVARLLIHSKYGDKMCTGWLLGSEGHLLTNHHCIANADDAAHTEVAFMAEGSNCSSDCSTRFLCPGVIVADSATFIATDRSLDFTLIKLNTTVNVSAVYGYLKLRNALPIVGERIFIPQYPKGGGKRVALSGGNNKPAIVEDYSICQCGSPGLSYTGIKYSAATDEGSSGSPVIAYDSNTVLALHQCGNTCANSGIPSIDLLRKMVSLGVLPLNGVDVYTPDLEILSKINNSVPSVLQATVKGGIVYNGALVSVDKIEFEVVNDTQVTIDVLSFKISDVNDNFVDVMHDCDKTYIDAAVFVFPLSGKRALYSNDNNDLYGKEDGSVSSLDPFLQVSLPAGTYTLAIGLTSLKEADALNGVAVSKYPEIYDCRTNGVNYGSYQVSFSSSSTIRILRQSNTYQGAACQFPKENNETLCDVVM